MAGTVVASLAVLMHAGKDVSSDLLIGPTVTGQTAEIAVNVYINQAEHKVSVSGSKDWIADYGTAQTNLKQAVDLAVAVYAANMCIAYDPSGYISRDAETIIDVNKDIFDKVMKDLDDKDKQKRIQDGL